MTAFRLILFAIIHIQYVFSELTTYSITPMEPSDMITIKLPNENSNVNSNTDPATWRLQNPSKPYSWGIHLQSLSKLFTSKHSCTLNITINGIQKSKTGAIFYVFSIGSSFISFAHDFDGNLIINGKKGIFIYPQCHSKLGKISLNSKIGELYNGVRGSKSLRQKLSETTKDAMHTQWTSILDNNDISISFPIYFIIKNYYIKNKSIFQFYDTTNDNIIECEYNTAFPINKGFNLFMSTDINTNKQIFDISKFIISKDCNKQNCEQNAKRMKHIEWIDHNNIQNENRIYNKENIRVNEHELSININIDLLYLEYSIYENNKYDVMYTLGFNDLNEYNNDICANKWDIKNKNDKCG
eukprot:110749_1